MRPVLRDRLAMPILLPLVTIAVIAAVLYGFSRILLSITPSAATATATVVALGIVVAAAVAAGRPQVRLSTIASMIGVITGVAMLAGGLALAVATGGEEGEGEPGGPVLSIVARDIAFETTSLTVPAGEAFTIAFDNQDAGIQHNVEIFEDPAFSGQPVFAGDLVTGVVQVEYPVPALGSGTYAFRCVVHPTMVGELRAEEGAAGGEGGAGAPQTVIAQGIAFDTSTIELPARSPSTIAFENRDAGVQHNIAIYTNSALDQELFNGALITGPASETYEIPPLEAGEYYFLCVVHPNMNGTVVVSGGGGGPGGAGPAEPTGST